MNLIKKIVSCSLTLSLAFSGIYTTATKTKTGKQQSSGISLTQREKRIIGGACAAGGVEILTAIGYGIWHSCVKPSDNPPVAPQIISPHSSSDSFDDNEFNILIIGGKPENRQKIIDELKQGKFDRISYFPVSSNLKGVVHQCMANRNSKSRLPEVEVGNPEDAPNKYNKLWNISDRGTEAEDVDSLIQRSHLIIAILDDTQESDGKIGQLLLNNEATQHSRIITLIDYNLTVPNTPLKGANGGNPTIKECIDFFRQYERFAVPRSFLKFEHMDILLSDFAYYWEISPQGVGYHNFHNYVSPLTRPVPNATTVDADIGWIKTYQELLGKAKKI